jgi:hypothetical protein
VDGERRTASKLVAGPELMQDVAGARVRSCWESMLCASGLARDECLFGLSWSAPPGGQSKIVSRGALRGILPLARAWLSQMLAWDGVWPDQTVYRLVRDLVSDSWHARGLGFESS